MGKKRSLAARYQESYRTKDTGATNPAFNWRDVREFTFFKPIMGKKSRINIIPYVIKNKLHPLVRSGAMQVGDLDYVFDYYVHRKVGPSGSDVLCPKRMFGKPCPICELAEEKRKQGRNDEVQDLRPQRRVLYNVVDLSDPDAPEADVQVFDASHFNFEKELIEAARAESDDQNIIDFADPDNGKTVVFRTSEGKYQGRAFSEYKSFQFVERDEDVTEEQLAEAISFDEIMKVLSYDEIQRLLYGGDDEFDEEPSPSPSKGKAKAKVKDEDEDEDEDEPAPPVKNVSKTASKDVKKVKDEDEDEDEDEDKPTPTPPVSVKRGPGRPPGSKNKPKDEDEDEDKPAVKDDKKNGDKCPHGYRWGKDNDEHQECDDCTRWKECCKAGK